MLNFGMPPCSKNRQDTWGFAANCITASFVPKCFIHRPERPPPLCFSLNSESNKGIRIKTESPRVLTSVTLNRSAPLITYRRGTPFIFSISKLNGSAFPGDVVKTPRQTPVWSLVCADAEIMPHSNIPVIKAFALIVMCQNYQKMSRLLQHFPRYDNSLNFGSAFIYLRDLGIAHQPFHVV